MTAQPRSIAQDVGLFLVAVLSVNLACAVWAGDRSTEHLMTAFYLIAFVHIGISLYDRVFRRIGTMTWLLLILGWVIAECLSFVRHLLPIGQALFWLATNAPWAAPMLEWLMANSVVVPLLLLTLLAVDVVTMHVLRWNKGPWWQPALVVVAAIIANLVLGLAFSGLLPAQQQQSPSSFAIVPPWYLLPLYAIMRAFADKNASLIAAFLALLAPVFWPWMKAGTLRLGRLHWVWLAAWLAFVGSFLGLAYLGSRSADDGIIVATRIVTAYYFAFLLVIPRLLRRSGTSIAAEPA
jgi:quinol-cytochrome oxidoreductase complex cytochrome b subunit